MARPPAGVARDRGTGDPRTGTVLELLLWSTAVAAPLAPPGIAAAVLATVALLHRWIRPPRREGLATTVTLALVVLVLLVGSRLDPARGWAAGTERWSRAYRSLWSDLDRRAGAVTDELTRAGAVDPRSAWPALVAATGKATDGITVLLLDTDGRARVWAGEGLLHDLPVGSPMAPGRSVLASFGAVTLVSVMETTDRPWPARVVAARSLETDRPLVGPWPAGGPPHPWSVLAPGSIAAPGASPVTVAAGTPPLVLAAVETEGDRGGDPATPRRAAWAVLAALLLALAVRRAAARARSPDTVAAPGVLPVGLGGLAMVAAALTAGASAPVALALAGGLAVLVWGLAAGHSDGPPRGAPVRVLAGSLAMAVLFLVLAVVQRFVAAPDLAGGFGGPIPSLVLRLAGFATAVGLLALAAGRGRGGGPRERWAWLALALFGTGGALVDRPAAALTLIAAGGAAAALWPGGRSALRRPGPLAVLAVLAALASAAGWETLYRRAEKDHLEQRVLPRMGPPGEEERTAAGRQVARFFATLDLATLVPRNPAGLDRQDLAFALWRRSPLARANTFSALVVEPAEGPPSTFSFGRRLTEERLPEARRESLLETPLPVWEEQEISGSAELRWAGRPWARVHWWLWLRPGFRLAGPRPVEETTAGLLAGGPRREGRLLGLPGQAVYALYTPAGRPLVSPWEEVRPLPDQVAWALDGGLGRTLAPIPGGRAWAFPAHGADGIEVLYLPRRSARAALERTCVHALGTLVSVAALGLLGLLLALSRPGFRRLLQSTYRSYSRRLLVVYTLLLLVPLLLLNGVLLTGAYERFEREQEARGLAALRSIQRVLLDDLKDRVGLDLETSLSDDYLSWLSRVVDHDVNLYWENNLWASSKAELFAAGVLPRRIPGEVHARLELLGYDLASRVNRVGATPYLEIYAPAGGSGEGVEEGSLTLSLPLLAQQEEVARELAALRRQALLVTAALFGLLVVVGLRLARSFTGPLLELVEGTRRIAAGAASLDLAPRELELAALVEAVDEMARRIAQGRQRLLREKQVVERIVDSITSAVVSVDQDRRVLLRNRVAEGMLGVEVGESLDAPGRALPDPVGAFLKTTGEETRQRTVSLTDGAGKAREWTLIWVPVPGDGEPSALLVVEDATEVLRAQRLEAWAQMARIIAHEIKNPLTPVRLNAEHLLQVWRSDRAHLSQVLERCIGNILAQVDELHQIASEFSTYSSILRIERKSDDLVAAMEELVEPYRAAPPPGVTVRFESDRERLAASFDRRLLSRAVRNLIENSLRASSGGGTVTLSVSAAGATGRIAVRDQGPGVPSEILPRIFDPYFSTHATGTGLGLPIARRVAEEHGGTITAENIPGGGLAVVLALPLEGL